MGKKKKQNKHKEKMERIFEIRKSKEKYTDHDKA
jgi:hypothetical protein